MATVALLCSAARCGGGAAVDRDKSQTRAALAVDFLLREQLDPAEQEANRALGYDPKNELAVYVLGQVEYGRARQNFRLLEVEDCLTGVDAEALREELEKHLLAADGHLAKAAGLAPDYGDAWAVRGEVAIQLERYDDAIKYLETAVGFPARLSNISLTRADLGWAYFLRGQMPQAAKELRQSEQFNPGLCIAQYRLGRVYFERKEWEKAFDKFHSVVARGKACAMQEAHLYLMKTYVEMGMSESVPPVEQSCVELAPDSCIAAQCRAARKVPQ